ncbi:MAG: hypothetical protein SFV52_05895 [Saprospiraceae bacterium]|nr:hypothetical protein [Saprospiraceae bacterium]
MTIRTVLLQLFLTLGMPIALSAQNVIPDPAFGDAGSVNIQTSGFLFSGYHHLMPDGRIVFVGTVNDPGSDATDVYVARLLTDGTFDPSFGGGNGFVRVAGPVDKANDLYANAVDGNGKVILAINEYDFDVDRTRFVRLNADGTPDNTFGVAGEAIIDIAAGDLEEYMTDVVVLPDGKLFFGGYVGTAFDVYVSHFVRLNNDGSLDNTYDNDGKFSMPVLGILDGAALALDLLPDNKIAVAGLGANAGGNAIPYIARLGVDGKPDPSFGTNGRRVFSNLPLEVNYLYDIAVQNNGQWLVGGSSLAGGAEYNENLLLFRFNSDGSLDQGFAGTGYFEHDQGAFESILKVAATADNRPLIAGYTSVEDVAAQPLSSLYFLGRLTGDGISDPDFNGGFVTSDTLIEAAAFSVSIQNDGKMLLSGYTFDGEERSFFVNRYAQISGLNKLRPVLEAVMLFPNPAADHTNLRFTLEKSTVFGVQLVNAEGKSITALTPFRTWTAGEHQIRFGLPAGLPTGNYRIVVQGNEGVHSIPVTIR